MLDRPTRPVRAPFSLAFDLWLRIPLRVHGAVYGVIFVLGGSVAGGRDWDEFKEWRAKKLRERL